ncbi:MAG TPA: UDP-glucose 4-epimerase GalE [Bryobacteraceae bacterium]|nr:UDP-glucose 4-epimerase GalE [Bryobacteraceae bacterium]
MNILVTGGAGYIGSHACKALAANGFQPVVYDSLVRGHRSLVKWGDLVVGDLHDTETLAGVFRRYQPAGVLHFAAFAYVGESVEHPQKYFHNNVGGSLQLLRVLLEHGTPPIVFSSTCATYGVPRTLPITETSEQDPTNPYGLTKLMVEKILRAYSEAYGLRAMILRYFNACGDDPAGEIGELHDPEPHLIPRVLQAAAGNLEALEIFGTDYPTRDGTCVRDYIHVSDLADAHVAALRLLLAGSETRALNLGIGTGFTVREVIRAAERVTGRSIAVRESPRRPGDPPELVANSSLAASVLGLRPRFTNIEEMIQTAWAWHNRT